MATSYPTTTRTFRDAYAPAVPSPLNPSRHASAPTSASPSPSPSSTTTPTRPTNAQIRRRSKNARKWTSVSPTQKLLRQKAAEAWRGELLRRQAARIEARRIQAMAAQKALEARLQRVLQGVPSIKPGEAPSCGFAANSPNEPQPYTFHMPDVGFFTPRKVVLAMGLMRRTSMPPPTPSLGNENFLRVPMAA